MHVHTTQVRGVDRVDGGGVATVRGAQHHHRGIACLQRPPRLRSRGFSQPAGFCLWTMSPPRGTLSARLPPACEIRVAGAGCRVHGLGINGEVTGPLRARDRGPQLLQKTTE